MTRVRVLALSVFTATLVALALIAVRPPTPAVVGQGGWVRDDAAVAAVKQGLEFQTYSQTPAYRAVLGAASDHAFLWDAEREVLGDVRPPKNQGNLGSCVSFGTANALEALLCVQIVEANRAGNPPPKFKPIAPEPIYGGSRIQIGQGRVRGDGSVGAWAGKWVQTRGLVPAERIEIGSSIFDLTTYSVDKCRTYGNQGCPKALEEYARAYPVRDVVQVNTWAEAKAALDNGHPIILCSIVGYAARRDALGFCARSGQWGHCTALVGYRTDREGGYIVNSWGTSYHSGPVGAGNPSPAGFWADAKNIQSMLNENDSWAFGDAKGFPAKKIKWFSGSNIQGGM